MTTQQARNKVANIFFGSIIIAGLFMSYGAYVATEVFAKEGVSWNAIPQDDNLIDNKPTPRWRLNSNGYSQRYVELSWNTRDDRAIDLLNAYWFTGVDVWLSIKKIAWDWGVYPEAIICIAYADSSLGRFLKTKHNYGNVWNNDRGDTVEYDSIEQGFNAIGKVLNNKYLSYIYTIDYLSRYGNATGMVYATSPENQFINMANCLSMIHNKKIPDDWKFRR